MLFLSDRTSRISYFQQKRSKVWLCVHKRFLAAIPKFRKFCFISASEWQHTVLIKKSGSHNPLTNLRGTVRLQLELYWAPGEGVCLAREHTVCICAPHVRRTGGPVEEPATEGRAALVHGIPPRKSVAWLERPFISWMSLTLLSAYWHAYAMTGIYIRTHDCWPTYKYCTWYHQEPTRSTFDSLWAECTFCFNYIPMHFLTAHSLKSEACSDCIGLSPCA